MTKSDPFRFTNSILDTKEYCFLTEDDEREFNPFLTQRALSQHIDCIPYVIELAQYDDMPKKAIYDYFFYSIRQMKRRFKPWPKKVTNEDVEMISKYYQISYQRAEEYVKVLSESDIEGIRQSMETGGIHK